MNKIENLNTNVIDKDGVDGVKDYNIGIAGKNRGNIVKDPATSTVGTDINKDQRRPSTNGRVVARCLTSPVFLYSLCKFFLFFFSSSELETSSSFLASTSNLLMSFIDTSINKISLPPRSLHLRC